MIERINPEKIIPIHTNRVETFKKFMSQLDCEIIIPKESETIDL